MKTKYLLVEIANQIWKVQNLRPFDSQEAAWEWADLHYGKDEDRLRLYLFPVRVSAEMAKK